MLLEVSPPEACGYEICHELRQAYGDSLPIVLVSADRTASADRVAGLLVGADDYLLKPTDTDELVARVRRLAAVHSRAQAGALAYREGPAVQAR